MRVKVSLDTKDEWNDCWLETEYLGIDTDHSYTNFACFSCYIYPTTWFKYQRNDGFSSYMNIGDCPIKIKNWVEDCKEYLKPKEENDRITTALQKVSSILKWIFPR